MRRQSQGQLPRNPSEAESEVRRLLASGRMTMAQFEALKKQAEGILAILGK